MEPLIVIHGIENIEFSTPLLGVIVSILGLTLSTLMAVIVFRKNNSIKAAELLQKYEEDYKNHIPILLQIEYSRNTELKKAILKVYLKQSLSLEDDALIEAFEKALRHFFECYILYKKKLDNKLFNRVHRYYLNILCNGEKHEITTYIIDYWPSIYRWYLVLSLPWFYQRIILWLILDEDLPFPRNIEKQKKRFSKSKSNKIENDFVFIKPSNKFRSQTRSFLNISSFISKFLANQKFLSSTALQILLLPYPKRKLLKKYKVN